MLRLLLIAVAALFIAQNANAQQVQFFPPQGPCSADNPILAWNGSGATYCTKFPTEALPDCKDGQFLTKKNGNLVCSDLTGQNVSAPTPATTSTTTTPTTTTTTTTTTTNPYNSNGTPTGAPQRVAATGGTSTSTAATSGNTSSNRSCPAVYVPVCASDSVLVDYGYDYNGCQTSPQCHYVGYGNVASTYASAGYTVPAYLDTYVEPVYIETPYVEPYVESAPTYDEPYYAPDDSYDE